MEIKNSFRLISSLGKDRIILLCSFFYMVILLPVMAGCANSQACVSEEIPFWLTPDSTICSHLDGDLKKVLFMPDSVKCYVLVQKDSISEKGLSPVENYVRDSLMAEFGVRETTVLQYVLLSNPQSYSTDSVKIEAPYLPILEFVFSRENSSSASVILSVSDRSWAIMYDNKQQFRYNYADWRTVERFCSFYINEYFKTKEK